jgi:hypothetical protein
VTDEEATALREQAARNDRTGDVQAPKILALSGQEATVYVAESENDRPGTWAGFHAAVTPRVSASGDAVVFDRLRVEKRATIDAVPQVVEAAGLSMQDGQTLAVGSSDPAADDFVVLITARVLPATSR